MRGWEQMWSVLRSPLRSDARASAPPGLSDDPGGSSSRRTCSAARVSRPRAAWLIVAKRLGVEGTA
jgi:hypothetical protein